MQKIVSSLWYDTEAMEAATFYTQLFKDSSIIWTTVIKDTPSGDSEQVYFQLAGLDFYAISAGPYFTLNPSISLMVYCETIEEVNHLWEQLVEGGSVLMDLDSQTYSERYGWLVDRFGLSWQLIYSKEPVKQKIQPVLLFANEQYGKAKEALKLYQSTFKQYEEDVDLNGDGTVLYASVQLEDYLLNVMESNEAHDFTFNEAFSFMVYCEDQAEIDYYWEKLSAVPEAEQCGWLKDTFDISWQIVPREMDEMMQTTDEAAKARVVEAFLPMKKIKVAELQRAFEGN